MADLGFTFKVQNSDVIFFRNNVKIKRIRGLEAQKFIDFTKIQSYKDIQIKIAKLTGNYKRGNERQARKHQRNM